MKIKEIFVTHKLGRTAKRSAFLKMIKTSYNARNVEIFEFYRILPGRDEANSCVYRLVRFLTHNIGRSFSSGN
jgi:hypothetical protein